MSKTLEIKILTQLQDKLSAPLKRLQSSSKSTEIAFKALRTHVRDLEGQMRNISSFKKLESDLQTTSNKLTIAQSKFDELNKEVMSSVNPSKALTAQMNLARQEVEKLTQKHTEQNTKLADTKNKLESAGISTKNLASHEADLTNKIKSANSELGQHHAALQKAAETQKKLGDAKSKMANTQQLASNMAISGTAGYMTAQKVLGGMASVMKPGVEFDSTMSKVQALTRLDKDSEELAELRQQARDLGASTMFSATEAADAQGFLAMAGFTPKAIKGAMPGMLDVAKAGGIDLARAADISSNILSGFNLDASQMGRVGDVLTGAFTRSNTNLEMLGETMKHAAPMAASLNVDIETLAAATGKLGDAGIQGSMAGTALKSILNRLSKPPKAAAEALDELNIKTMDAKGNLRDFPSILEELNRKTAKMGNAQRAGYFKAIAGEEAVSSLTVLVDKAGTGELQKLESELKNSSGEAAKVAKTMADNIVGDLDELSSAWEDIGISMFDGQNGILRGLVQNLTSVINVIGSWIKENPELTGTIVKVVAVIAAVVAGMGALAVTIASVLGPFAMLRYAFSYISIAGAGGVGIFGKLAGAIGFVKTAILAIGRVLLANPIVLIIAAIASAAYLVWKNWDYLKIKVAEIWSSITQVFSSAWQALVRINSAVGNALLSAFMGIWNSIVSFFSAIWNTLKTAASGGLAGIGALIVNWSPLGLFYQAFAAVLSWFGFGLPSSLTGAVSNIISSISNKVSSWNIASVFQTVWSGVTNLFNGYITQFTSFGSNLISGLVNGINNMAGAAKEAISKVGSGVVGWFKEKLGIHSPSRVFMGLGGFVSEGLAKGIETSAGVAVKASQALATGTLAGAASLSAMQMANAAPIKFDHRPALSVSAPARATAPTIGGDTINIHVHASQGQNAQDIARLVKQEIERLQAQKHARTRSSYTDYGY